MDKQKCAQEFCAQKYFYMIGIHFYVCKFYMGFFLISMIHVLSVIFIWILSADYILFVIELWEKCSCYVFLLLFKTHIHKYTFIVNTCSFKQIEVFIQVVLHDIPVSKTTIILTVQSIIFVLIYNSSHVSDSPVIETSFSVFREVMCYL